MASPVIIPSLDGVPTVRVSQRFLPGGDTPPTRPTTADEQASAPQPGGDRPDDPKTVPDTIVVGLFRGNMRPPGTEEVLEAVGLGPDADLRTASFSARVGEATVLATPTAPWDRVVITGLGQVSGLTPEVLRRAAGAASREVATLATHVTTTLAQVDPADGYARAVVEGLVLGAHRDQRFRSDPRPSTIERLTIVASSGRVSAVEDVAPTALRHARGQLVARELVTTPAGQLGPVELADWTTSHLGDRFEVKVLEEADLVEAGCGGLLSVAAGSVRPPRLVRVRHRAERAIASVALVGKGITFDAGGLSLKSPEGQEVMKKDMGGVAVLLGVLSGLAEQLSIDLTAWLSLAENMPSGSATRPGDVITIADGTTVTVANTDAEGRLVMADALALASREQPDAIIDVATLTGAVQQAVGRRAFGVFGNDDGLLDRVLHAAETAGEAAWHLPLWQDLDPELDDETADIVNVVWPADRERGGATIAGLFLQHFVDDVPWVHLDVSGAAWATEARGHLPEQATGVGVRTLLHLLEATSTSD